MRLAHFSFQMALSILSLVLTLFAVAPASAQPAAPNPTALSVKEADLLKALKEDGKVAGRISIPDERAANLIQPAGQSWSGFRQGTLHRIGAVAILGITGMLALFYLIRGRIRIEAGPSGRTITRFGGLERFIHWLTSGTFIILALSGLNLIFGRTLVIPLLGEEAFATATAYGKLAHNFLAFPFMIGLALMFVVWVRDNIPGKLDLAWFKAGGGLFSNGVHPPAKRFNGGQKLIFWMVIGGGAALSVSGWFLLFPYLTAGVSELQLWLLVHGIVAVLLSAGIIAHAYIGSVGMEGAFDAMGSGEVDLNWAKEHHSLWVAEQQAKGKGPAHGASAMPAE
jgi:formate dehydrogenase subunit gamma